jgi:hypothetical protein
MHAVLRLAVHLRRTSYSSIATWVYSSVSERLALDIKMRALIISQHSTCPACRREFLPESIVRPESDQTEPFSLAEVRELVRVLQLGASGLHADADGAHHNPFSEGTAPGTQGPGGTTGDEQDLDYLRRMQDELMRGLFASEQRGQSEPRESFGMYS